MADLLVFKEENQICFKFDIEEGSLHRNCINRFRNKKKGSIYYINTRCLNYGESEYWITDLFQHDHDKTGVCWRCIELERVYKAQKQFLELHTELLKDESVRSVFRDQIAGSSLFGGYPKVLYEDLVFINDWRYA